jgi:hypothetical protein
VGKPLILVVYSLFEGAFKFRLLLFSILMDFACLKSLRQIHKTAKKKDEKRN